MLVLLILDPGQFLMERKMLLEIKRRAESDAGSEPIGEPVLAGSEAAAGAPPLAN